MLILTRKPGQSINIGTDISVTVLRMEHGQVRIGVTAPKDIAVHRDEVTQRIAAEQAAARKAG